MHLMILHQNFVDHKHPGGTRHLELGTNLVEMGSSVTIVASNLDYLTGRTITGQSDTSVSGVRILRAAALPLLHHSLLGRVASYVSYMFTSVFTALRAEKPDTVLGTSPPLFQLPSAWLVARWHRKPFLLEIRDLWPKFAIDMGLLKSRFLIWCARRVESFFYRAADHIVVNSPAYKTYLVDKNIAAEKVTVIPNGVDVHAFHPESRGQDVRDQFGLNGKFVVTYAGAMGPANDLGTLLAAAREIESSHPNVQFLLAGGGIEKEKLQATAINQSNVTFAGHFEKSRVPELLAASDLCVACLQDLEAFKTVYPNKVFDYMAAGRPTVLAIDGVIRDVIENSGGGKFVPPGNAKQLASTVVEFFETPELLKQMGQSAREYVVEHFDRKIQAKQLRDLVQHLADRRSQRPTPTTHA